MTTQPVQKRAAAIHDISGFGKCSLTVALPIISATGIEVSAMPTAVLSTHTGGFSGFTYRDLTEDLLPFARHWQSLHLHFDAIYSGFLGSYEQIDMVSEIFDMLKSEDTLIVVDPCMADNGALYQIYTPQMAQGMKKLCSKADIIVPNLTEASLLLGKPYQPGPYTKEYIEEILFDLLTLGCKKAVLTGVYFENHELGSACCDGETGEISYAFAPRVEGSYHGTGDVFASVLVSAILNDCTLKQAIQIAADFTTGAIRRTKEAKTDVRFGVNFEAELPNLIKRLNL